VLRVTLNGLENKFGHRVASSVEIVMGSDSCECEHQQHSVDCVKRHVADNNARLKFELGTAYYEWQFNQADSYRIHYSVGELRISYVYRFAVLLRIGSS
jgi:hypothetical protein